MLLYFLYDFHEVTRKGTVLLNFILRGKKRAYYSERSSFDKEY
jgi:hypothetical protein